MIGTKESTNKDAASDNNPSRKVTLAAVEEALKGITFPADKNDLMECASESDAREDIMDVLNEFTDQEYRSITEIAREFGRVDAFLQESYQGGIVGATKVREHHEENFNDEQADYSGQFMKNQSAK